jgi:flavin reductase (DIM6/NTAB) family NADH-FMN oxidoreductase RutF
VLGPEEFRRLLGRFASGVTVVTTSDPDGSPTGLTVSAFASVSLGPPLVLVCIASKAQSHSALLTTGRFAVNILSSDQEALSARFASSPAAGAAEKFRGIAYRRSATGLPLLDGVLAHLECSIVAAHEAGDHTILVGQVEAGSASESAEPEPLLYFRGRYGRLARTEPA